MRDVSDATRQDAIGDALEAEAYAVEMALLAVIARRLGKVKGAPLALALASSAADSKEMRKALAEGSAKLQKSAAAVIAKMADENDEWASVFYAAAGMKYDGWASNALLARIVEQAQQDAAKAIDSMLRTSVLAIRADEATVPLGEGYRRLIAQCASGMVGGKLTGDEAVLSAVVDLSRYGTRVVYASGNTRELYAAVRMNVMDTYRATMVHLREAQGREFGADGVEISAHALCAEDHLPYQGRRYTNSGFRELQSRIQVSKGRPICTGANCRHTLFPVIMGVSARAYSEKQLASLRKQSTRKVNFTDSRGKAHQMTAYDATQYQRRLESAIRRTRLNSYLDRQAGELDSASRLKVAADDAAREYARISSEMGLATRMERTLAELSK